MGIKRAAKRVVKKVAGKAADGVSKLSALSPEQLEKVEADRSNYLAKMPDMTDQESREFTNRLLAKNAVEIYNAYLSQLSDLYLPIDEQVEYDEDFRSKNNIRYINITKWVTDKKENSLEKLINIYEVLSSEECNISLIFQRQKDKTKVYLAITNTENADNNVDVDNYSQRLQSAIKGNFPGSTWNQGTVDDSLPCFNPNLKYSVAIASNIPTEKSEKFISQTIEKLLDGFIPENTEDEYILVLLATPIQDIEERKLTLSKIYSDLVPYASWQTNFTYSESKSRGSSATIGVNIGASAGQQNSVNRANTDTSGTSNTKSQNSADGSSHSESKSDSKGKNKSTTNGISAEISTDKIPMIGKIIPKVGVNHSKSSGSFDAHTKTVTDSISKSVAKGKSLTKSASRAITSGTSNALNFGVNVGANFARTSTTNVMIGKNEGITQSFINHNIKHALELLDLQMKRLEQSTALGMWDFAAYVLSENSAVANNIAHSYLALTQGDASNLSESVVNIWRGDVLEEADSANAITSYLKNLRHPLFGLNPRILETDETFNVYPPVVTATTALSGKELAYSLNFPQKSIAGLPVFECAEFGRNISTYKDEEMAREISLGHIFHMNRPENIPVSIDLNSLASHTFITGSTGTGKSNTIYKILDESLRQGVKFLVIEPAKGEYKHIFGSRSDVAVYGTNPDLTPLLRLNPFSFSKGIHVLEHLDRLVEIFNVCWPMYAAMPAVLKSAIEKAYEDAGWDLLASKNPYGNDLYPTFEDVLRNIRVIIDSSDYDNENKGAYKGSLLTRLQSLTNGINGMIFSNQAIPEKVLFDENVIIDLSRVGSTETKALIMGILVLKLQEYRMTATETLNNPLQHLTILEEAHNILKRTSTEQADESSNLLGKSVEMIANSIAEMRTYGEGFIIADQAPGLMDMSVIRNTNTKIIMRIPDLTDRELVGRSANLNNDQITELAKLPKGVGAVYQNEWIEPILCQMDKFESDGQSYLYEPEKVMEDDSNDRLAVLELLAHSEDFEEPISVKDIHNLVDAIHVDSLSKRRIFDWLLNPHKEFSMHNFSKVSTALYPELLIAVVGEATKTEDEQKLTQVLSDEIATRIPSWIQEQTRRDLIQAIMTYYYLYELKNEQAFQDWAHKGGFA